MDELQIQSELERVLGIVPSLAAQAKLEFERLFLASGFTLPGGPGSFQYDIDSRTRLVRLHFQVELDRLHPSTTLAQLHTVLRQVEPMIQGFTRRSFFLEGRPTIEHQGPLTIVTCYARGILERV